MTQSRRERHSHKGYRDKITEAVKAWLRGNGRKISEQDKRNLALTIGIGVAIVVGNFLMIPLLTAWLPDHIGDLVNMPNSSISSTDWLETDTQNQKAFPYDLEEETALLPLNDTEKTFLEEERYQRAAWKVLQDTILGEYAKITDAEGILPTTQWDKADWSEKAKNLSSQTVYQMALERRPSGKAAGIPERWIVTRAQVEVSGRNSSWWLDIVSHPEAGILYCRLYPQEEISGYLTLDDSIRTNITEQANAFIRKLIAANAEVQEAYMEKHGEQTDIYGIHVLSAYQEPESVQTEGMTCVLTYQSNKDNSYFLVYYDMSMMQVSGFSFNYGE